MRRLAALGRYRLIALVVGAVVTLLVIAFAIAGLGVDLELKTLDYRFILQGTRSPRSDIVLVGVTEASLAELGAFPWPRATHAAFVEKVAAGGARAIVFDVMFVDPASDPAQDLLFAKAIRRAGNVVLAAVAEFGADAAPGVSGVPRARQVRMPVAALADAAAGVGVINVLPDQDRLIRTVPLAVEGPDGKRLWSLSAQAVRQYLGIPAAEVRLASGRLILGALDVPTDRWARMYVNFTGGAGNFPVLDYHKVLSGAVPASALAGKLVLVAPMAAGLGDAKMTPFALLDRGEMFGGEIHANAIDTMLRRNFLRPASLGVTIPLVAAFAMASGAAVEFLHPAVAGGLLTGMLLGLFALAQAAFSRAGSIIELVYPALAVILTYGSSLLMRFLAEESERRRVQRTFSRYVSRTVVDEILKNPDAITLGGTLREISVLFADLRGFTPMSEKLPPKRVVEILNQYLAKMVGAVFETQGTLDKFMGDCVMAFWNSPVPQADHAVRAVRTGIALQRAVEAMRPLIEAEGFVPPKVGVGINTGEAVVGNIGTVDRLEFTAIGDHVNLASRLKDLAAGGEILVGQATYDLMGEAFVVEAAPPAEVKGKAELVPVYRVIGVKEAR
jgi:adenylate cyclase